MALSQDDSEICAAWKRDDMMVASTKLLADLGPEIRDYLVRVHGDLDAANDVFSMFCERIWRKIPDFEWRCSARTWAYTIARRISIDYSRSELRRTRWTVPISQASETAMSDQHDRSTAPPHFQAASSSIWKTLQERLPPEDRWLLALRIDRQLSWSELARVLLEGTSHDGERTRKEAARLRKRFQLLKDRLRSWIIEDGLLPSEEDIAPEQE